MFNGASRRLGCCYSCVIFNSALGWRVEPTAQGPIARDYSESASQCIRTASAPLMGVIPIEYYAGI